MKTLNEILSEGLLDADFDVSAEDVYVDNITNKVIEIASSRTVKNYDKVVNELYDLLKGAARERQEQDTSSIIRKIRAGDSTCIFMSRRDDKSVLAFLSSVKRHRPYLGYLQLAKRSDGAGHVYAMGGLPVNTSAVVTRKTKETLVFLGPEVLDEVIAANQKR